jgi:hypothetical protein
VKVKPDSAVVRRTTSTICICGGKLNWHKRYGVSGRCKSPDPRQHQKCPCEEFVPVGKKTRESMAALHKTVAELKQELEKRKGELRGFYRSFAGHVYVKNEEYAALCEAAQGKRPTKRGK